MTSKDSPVRKNTANAPPKLAKLLPLQRGERAEALRCYRRCRELLSISMSLAPSAETEALYLSIGSV